MMLSERKCKSLLRKQRISSLISGKYQYAPQTYNYSVLAIYYKLVIMSDKSSSTFRGHGRFRLK